jgi:VanZ family protein
VIPILLVVALIAYGSLYPLSFRENPYASIWYILRSIPYTLTPRLAVDAIANVLFYIPLGLAIFLHARRSAGRTAGAIYAIVGSFSLSLSLEYLQFFQPGRIPSGADVAMNTTGGAIGVVTAAFRARLLTKFRAPRGVAVILWPAWLVSLLFPLMPAIGFYTVRMKMRGLAAVDTTVLVGACLQWLLAGVILASERKVRVLAMLLLIPAQLFIAERQPTLGLLAGALTGSAIALSHFGTRTTAGLSLVLLSLWGLAPFRFGPAHPFAWIPFADALESTRSGAIAVIAAKCFAYGGMIVVLMRAGLRLPASTTVVAVLLCATEGAQIWIAGRTPASTDPLIAILIAVVLALFRSRV